jgi:oligopeptide transport system substrate-binding protein
MSLRTRRSLVLGTSLMLLAVACGGGQATPTPVPQTAAPTATPVASVPTATGTPTESMAEVTPTPPPAGPGTLHLYLGDLDPPTLDPSAAQDSQSISVLNALHRGLLYFDKDLNIVPAAATALPTASADGKTLTFTLRSDAVYSDGSPILAGDFVYSMKRLVTPSLANPYAYLACPIVGVDQLLPDCGVVADSPSPDQEAALVDAIGVTAPDDHTVVVNLATAATYFSTVMAMWTMVPLKQSWVDSAPFGDAANYLSSGPYVMSKWDHNSLIELTPNPNWYGDQKATTTVDLEIGGDPDAAFASYQQGNLDAVVVPSTQLRTVLADPQYANQIQQLPQLAITYYDYATCMQPPEACPANNATSDGKSPTANKDFRIALTESIDKQQFIDLTFGGTGQIANSMVMPGIPGADPSLDPYPLNIDDANTHLATALTDLGVQDTNGDGTVDAKDLGTLTFGYNSNAGHLPRVVNLEEQWRKALGFDEGQFDLIGTDFSTFLQERTNGKYAISRDGWGADFPSAHNQLVGLFTCNGGNNDSQYCNPDVDTLLAQADQNPDPNAAATQYQQAQAMIVNDAPAIWLRFGLTTYLVQPWVQGLQGTSADSQNIGDRFYETITIAAH